MSGHEPNMDSAVVDRAVVDRGLGLRRGAVEVLPHRDEWMLAGNILANLVEAALPGMSVEHVGSTSVPGLAAKPVIDLAIAMPDGVAPVEVEQLLVPLGFEPRENLGSEGGWLYVMESEPDVVVVHAHAVAENDDQWRNYVLFRNALRGEPGLREGYEALKVDLAERFPDDRVAYTDGKSDWIRAVLASL